MVFSMASFVSGWTNYALSLAGVTGIIVSIGVTVDSYVVFFERLKDEVRTGERSRRSTAQLQDDLAHHLVGRPRVAHRRLILFWLTVGSVRGFAFFLGLTTSATSSSPTSSPVRPCCSSRRAS